MGHERFSFRVHEEIEDDERRGTLLRELRDTAFRGMDAEEQLVERERTVVRDDDFSVQHEVRCLHGEKRLDQLGEVARERLSCLGHQVDLVAIAEGEAAEAVPLRLVLPFAAGGKLVDELRLHGRVGPRDGKCHSTRSSLNRPRAASKGFHRSPSFLSRAGTLSMRKSSIFTPFSTSHQVSGVETEALGFGLGE